MSSGATDVVFWARNHSTLDQGSEQVSEESASMGQDVLELLLRDHPDLSESTLTEDEIAMIAGMQEAVTQIRSSENEQLDGTILSDPFYSDWYAYVIRK